MRFIWKPPVTLYFGMWGPPACAAAPDGCNLLGRNDALADGDVEFSDLERRLLFRYRALVEWGDDATVGPAGTKPSSQGPAVPDRAKKITVPPQKRPTPGRFMLPAGPRSRPRQRRSGITGFAAPQPRTPGIPSRMRCWSCRRQRSTEHASPNGLSTAIPAYAPVSGGESSRRSAARCTSTRCAGRSMERHLTPLAAVPLPTPRLWGQRVSGHRH